MTTQYTATYDTYDARGLREELSNRIYMITPEETPMVSLIGRSDVSSTHPEWQTDDLPTPSTTNYHVQGAEFTYSEPSPTTRVGNYTQIARRELIVSNTLEVVDKAGRKSEIAFQMAKLGVALRKDQEATILSNQASVVGTNTTPGRLGGLPTWLTSNDSRGSGGADGGFSSGTGLTVAATNGTQRAFTKTIMDTVMQSVYVSGGNAKDVICSPYVKSVFVTFMSDTNVAAFRYAADTGKNTIIGNADMYEGPFGLVTIIPNRVMSTVGATVARNVYFIDKSMISMGVLRPINQVKPSITGDAEKRVLITEYTLKVNNQQALGIAADIYGMTVSS
jgi:Family of unknown function (DUF5309)